MMIEAAKFMNECMDNIKDLIIEENAGSEWDAIDYFDHWSYVRGIDIKGEYSLYIISKLIPFIRTYLDIPYQKRILY